MYGTSLDSFLQKWFVTANKGYQSVTSHSHGTEDVDTLHRTLSLSGDQCPENTPRKIETSPDITSRRKGDYLVEVYDALGPECFFPSVLRKQ